MRRCLRHYSLYFAWLIALIATLASLYMSVLQNLPVCDLCWYQRICIYPLVILLGVAAYRDDTGVIIYALPLTILGFLFSLYQYLEQMIPGFSPIALCGPGVDCSAIHVRFLGFITLPFLGMIATAAIAFFLITARCYRDG